MSHMKHFTGFFCRVCLFIYFYLKFTLIWVIIIIIIYNKILKFKFLFVES
jgi:hypothetical protein